MSVGEQADARFDLDRLKPHRVKSATDRRPNSLADAGSRRRFDRRGGDNRDQGSTLIAGFQQSFQDGVTVSRCAGTGRIGGVNQHDPARGLSGDAEAIIEKTIILRSNCDDCSAI